MLSALFEDFSSSVVPLLSDFKPVLASEIMFKFALSVHQSTLHTYSWIGYEVFAELTRDLTRSFCPKIQVLTY